MAVHLVKCNDCGEVIIRGTEKQISTTDAFGSTETLCVCPFCNSSNLYDGDKEEDKKRKVIQALSTTVSVLSKTLDMLDVVCEDDNLVSVLEDILDGWTDELLQTRKILGQAKRAFAGKLKEKL